MLRPLKFHLVLILTAAAHFSSVRIAAAEEGGSTCSDMSAHQQVLDEGMKLYYDNGGAYSSSLGLDAESLELVPSTIAKPLYDLGHHEPNHITQNDYQQPKAPEPDVSTIRIASESDLSSAELYAQGREIAGDYTSARRLYERILAFRRAQPQMPTDSTVKDIERALLFRSARAYRLDKDSSRVAIYCNQIMDNIDVAPNINLETKLAMMETILDSFDDEKSNTVKRARQFCDIYRRELQCLNMAEDLNSAAFKLETAGMYPMAEKMYREALAIKEKNLGPNASDTLAQFGELARLDAEQGQIAQATEMYEKTLARYRKISSKGTGYSTLLQNYGDMLAHANQKDKADQIYSEARAFYASGVGAPANGNNTD